ncbi:MAG: helix-turn-helix transcriptional regulator [Acidobacteria bacterium]|nr:helix-turn-helix transcriptional regulator [Acidobacteriota bacterium]
MATDGQQTSVELRGEPLGAGRFFGEVLMRCRAPGLVMTDLRHREQRSFPSHSHELAYFSLLLEGGYAEQVGSRSFAHRPMTLAFHPPGLEHRDEVGDGGGHFFSVEVGERWFKRLREEARPELGFTVLTSGAPLWLAARLYRELRAPGAAAALVIDGLVLELLAAAGRLARPHERRPPAWLATVEDLLRQSYREPLTLDHLAAAAGVHPCHVSRTFRHFRGLTPGDFVHELRIRHLCEGLADPDRSLIDLALDAGFADQSHCNRIFKRVTGMTPGTFRAALRTSRPWGG